MMMSVDDDNHHDDDDDDPHHSMFGLRYRAVFAVQTKRVSVYAFFDGNNFNSTMNLGVASEL